MNNSQQNRTINIILALLLIIGIIVWVIDEGKDMIRENQLRQIALESQYLSEWRLNSINSYWNIPVCREAILNESRR